jgi:hypothetical protein
MTSFRTHDFPPLPSRSVWNTPSHNGVAKAKAPVSARSSVTINDLPDELLVAILQYIPVIDLGGFRFVSLVSLSSTNKRFRRLVVEELYATYDSSFCEPYLFLRTLISNPYRAESVKHASLTCSKWAPGDRQRYVGNAQDKKLIKEGLRLLGLPNWKTWATECNYGGVNINTLHTAILMHTPNVASLSIDSCGCDAFQELEWLALFKHAHSGTSLGRVHRFQNLRSIRIDMQNMSLTQIGPIFRTLSLRKICLENVLCDAFGGDDAYGYIDDVRETLHQMVPQRCNDIEEISLEHSFLNMDSLDIIIASSRRLKTLKYILFTDENDDNDSPTLTSLLQAHKASLENLTVKYGGYCTPRTQSSINLRDGMQGFTALKHIDCALSMLVGFFSATLGEKLPPSLLTLHVKLGKNASEDSLIALEDFASECSTRTPALIEIKVNVSELSSKFKYDWARLVALFSSTGVGLVVDTLRDESHDGECDDWETSSDESPSEASDEVGLYSDEG